jgi:hypothetical protein
MTDYLWKADLEMNIDIPILDNIIDILYNITSIDWLNKQFLSVYKLGLEMMMHVQTWSQMDV